MVISVRFYYFYIGILKFKTTRLRKEILWWLKAWWFATKPVYGLKIYRYMKSLEPRCKLTSLRPLLKEAFRKQLKQTALRVSQKKKNPLPFFLIFQSVNCVYRSNKPHPSYTIYISFPSIPFVVDRRAERSNRSHVQQWIRFESGKRYPQNVSINSNFTVDESFEARNRGFALSSETGCFSSRLRDERWNAMHLSWRRCFPETWGKHLSFPTPTGRARLLAC